MHLDNHSQSGDLVIQNVSARRGRNLRSDRRSAIRQHGLSVREGLVQEWNNSLPELRRAGIDGAARFRNGKGRHGVFND